jgi:hypothetical protein
VDFDNPPLRTLAGLVSNRVEPAAVPKAAWPEIIDTARRHGLGPMLFRICKKAGVLDAVPHPEDLRRAAWAAAARHALLETALLTTGRVLNQADIPAVWLKGIVLARTVYPGPWLRPMSDLDVLIPKEKLTPAVEALNGIGFSVVRDPGLLLPQDSPLPMHARHHLVLKGPPPAHLTLELHYHLVTRSDRVLSAEGLHWFLDQTEAVRIGADQVIGQTPEAALLYGIAHTFLQHGAADFRLLWCLDLHLLITRRPIDWHAVVEQARVLKWTHAVETALTRLSDLFHTPIPPWVLEYLQTRRPADEDTDKLRRMGADGRRWERFFWKLRGLGPAQAAQLAIRTAFPPPAFVRTHYRVPRKTFLLPWYLHRWKHQVREIRAWMLNRRR